MKTCWILLLCLFGCLSYPLRADYYFTTLDDPSGYEGTQAFGVYGTEVVGNFGTSGMNPTNGFLYTGSSFQTLDDPTGVDTSALGVSGTTIVGTFTEANLVQEGFSYSNGTFTTLTGPAGASQVAATGISGATIIGDYNGSNGFIYANGSYTTLDDPLGDKTFLTGISGNEIVGYYIDPDYLEAHGFVYHESTATFTTLDDPNVPFGGQGTYVTGIAGSTIVGYYLTGLNPQGFIFNETTDAYTTIDDPLGAEGTEINGISSTGLLVGAYKTSSGVLNGFEAAPEPPTVLLLGLGLAFTSGLLRRRFLMR